MKLNTGWMTKPINSLDDMGWGRTGAAAGAALGGTYGMFSDDSSMLGGAFKGAIGGFGMGKLARFGSKSFRDNAQMQTYKDKSILSQYPTSGWQQSFQNITNHANQALSAGLDSYNQLKATATSATP
mgnify:FL=1